LVSLQGLGYLFSFLSIPLLIKKFGYDYSGIIFTTQSIVFAIAVLSNYSLSFYIPTKSKVISDSIDAFKHYWTISVSIRLFLSIFFGVISIFICYFFIPEFFQFWLLSLPILISKIISPNLFYNAVEHNKNILFIGFISKLLYLIFIYFSTNYMYINFSFAISELIATILIINTDKRFKITKIAAFKEVLLFIKQTCSLFLVNFVSLIKPASILPIITLIFGSSYATIYTLADKFINIIRTVSGASYTSFYPIFNKEKIGNQIINYKTVLTLFLFSIVIVIFVWFIAPYLIYSINNFKFNDEASKILQILSLSIPVFFMIIPFFSLLLENKKWNEILLFALIQIGVLFSYYFFYHSNITNIAIGFVLSEYSMLFCYLLYTNIKKTTF